MGGGFFDRDRSLGRTLAKGYHTKSRDEVFQERNLHREMNPNGITLREARDSKEHPESVPIIIALDVTGSMRDIPHYLIKEGLINIMGKIIQLGIKDPQVLFLAIGDHNYDRAPLQVGQFESSDELLDKWLSQVYLEGGGGGNDGESYNLAWYFASKHTALDSFEKRNKKGFLFTIGDEPVLDNIPQSAVKNIMGTSQSQDYTSAELLSLASKMYNVYHIHLKQGSNGERQEVMDGWKQIIRNNLIIIDKMEEISKKIPEIIADNYSSKKVSSTHSQGTTKIETEEIL